MKLLTEIPLKKAENNIDYDSRLLLLGSCFSEHIGWKLEYFKFRVLQNPFGILFHPKAIENLMERAVLKKRYFESDVFFLNERWHCFGAHSDLSDSSKESLLQHLNGGLETTLNQIENCSHIAITLGTAWVYRHLASNCIVTNCHKVPQKEFSKELLSVEAIEEILARTIEFVRSINTNVQFIFTVSPVRHLKDGFIENQRSKAHLITAIHNLLDSPSWGGDRGEAYFPSYELMIDELRDYRFYEPDMVHPNQLAIDYIWEKFAAIWISEEARSVMTEVDQVQKGLQHRPFNPTSKQHQKFTESLKAKIIALRTKHPFMEF